MDGSYRGLVGAPATARSWLLVGCLVGGGSPGAGRDVYGVGDVLVFAGEEDCDSGQDAGDCAEEESGHRPVAAVGEQGGGQCAGEDRADGADGGDKRCAAAADAGVVAFPDEEQHAGVRSDEEERSEAVESDDGPEVAGPKIMAVNTMPPVIQPKAMTLRRPNLSPRKPCVR